MTKNIDFYFDLTLPNSSTLPQIELSLKFGTFFQIKFGIYSFSFQRDL
jgi:hypothetical protein